ncbi:hypothetical protein [Spirosoma pollinicola]|uniref:Lipocalin-like domain-containing protein n=1 Tax=Spirosoma pollinicola TaxID=2057025 RepID=A0A2K8Z5N0_9BACT|nr:hypothetical protein [Spirosoma pollinicola]AUD05134.1 hypothetical protein CWM47_26785 [Spirosoma pollinicola]
MKHSVYVICLMVSFLGLTSCNKTSDPVPVPAVVGRWELNRGLLSGFPTTANINGAALDLYYFESYGSTIDIYSDNTFNENYKSVTVEDAAGTWDFSNNTLTLKYDVGDEGTFTYSKNKNIEELAASKPVSYTLPVSTTATAAGQLQLIYRK